MCVMKKTMILVLLVSCLNAFAKNDDTAYVNKLITESKGLIGSEPKKAIEIAEQARDVAHKLDFTKGEALAIKNIGIVYYYQQNYKEALSYWEQSLALFEKVDDEEGISNILNNIAGIYMNKGVDDKALEYALRSLSIAEKIKKDVRILSALGTIGSVYHNKKDPRALDYMFRALAISQKEGKPIVYFNIGEVYFDLSQSMSDRKDSAMAASYLAKSYTYYDSSIVADSQGPSTPYAFNGKGKFYLKQGNFTESIANHQKALSISEKLEDKINMFRAYHGMGNAYLKIKELDKAIANYRKAQQNAEAIEITDVAELYRDMSTAYEMKGDLDNALEFQTLYAVKQKEIYDAEVEKQMGRMDLDYENQKKIAQVALLTKQKKIEQQAKYGFAGGLFSILVISVILFRNYKDKVRTNKLLDKQKDQIEGLLLNILPAEVARELQHTGKATPTHYDDVSVLFSDFKGFTTIADKMSPSELVSQLNTCFMAFDNIVEKYGLEKIKTIGDAYMCAGGIPMPNKVHSLNIVKAAREIQEWIKSNNEQRALKGLEPWDIRIGIHSGPLVAGVVGKKKYAYDIWGSTVNIASRMESNGEPGRVNLSAAAYEKIKDKYHCTYRGKIHAKNVGEIDMYFLGDEINETAEVADMAALSVN
jgi:adenylate cyclase